MGIRASNAISQLEKCRDVQSMRAVVDAAIAGDFTDEDTAQLAATLASPVQHLASIDGPLFDFASTGGASSLSTVLCPILLVALGGKVAKCTVPGRPAGSIDVYTQVLGYNPIPSIDGARKAIAVSGFAHILAGELYAPLDGAFFAYRQQFGATVIPELVVASILAKKLTLGIQRFAVDVRVSSDGNFGTTWADARRNAIAMRRVSRRLGIDAVIFLTDTARPCQPYIGRRESLVAVDDVFRGNADSWLMSHVRTCFHMCCTLIGSGNTSFTDGTQLRTLFADHLAAQGSDISHFDECVAITRSTHNRKILAEDSGFPFLDLHALRTAVVLAQQREEPKPSQRFADPLGIVLVSKSDTPVWKGEPLATVRCSDAIWSVAEPAIHRAFRISRDRNVNERFEEVRDGEI